MSINWLHTLRRMVATSTYHFDVMATICLPLKLIPLFFTSFFLFHCFSISLYMVFSFFSLFFSLSPSFFLYRFSLFLPLSPSLSLFLDLPFLCASVFMCVCVCIDPNNYCATFFFFFLFFLLLLPALNAILSI